MKDFIFKYFNECITVTSSSPIHKNHIFYIYDYQALRQIKLNRILGKNNKIKLNIKDSTIYFSVNLKTKELFVNLNYIWEPIRDYYKLNYMDIRNKISDLTNDKLHVYFSGFYDKKFNFKNATFKKVEYKLFKDL